MKSLLKILFAFVFLFAVLFSAYKFNLYKQEKILAEEFPQFPVLIVQGEIFEVEGQTYKNVKEYSKITKIITFLTSKIDIEVILVKEDELKCSYNIYENKTYQRTVSGGYCVVNLISNTIELII